MLPPLILYFRNLHKLLELLKPNSAILAKHPMLRSDNIDRATRWTWTAEVEHALTPGI